MELNIDIKYVILAVCALLAILVVCVLSQKDTWDGIGDLLRKLANLAIALVFIGVIVGAIYLVFNYFTTEAATNELISSFSNSENLFKLFI